MSVGIGIGLYNLFEEKTDEVIRQINLSLGARNQARYSEVPLDRYQIYTSFGTGLGRSRLDHGSASVVYDFATRAPLRFAWFGIRL
jgi:hypothetical protein